MKKSVFQCLHQLIFLLTVYVQGFRFLHILANTLLAFLILAVLTGVKWYFIVILIYISLISDIEHLFMCLLVYLYIYFGNMSIRFSAHFLTGYFYCCWVIWIYLICIIICISLYILYISHIYNIYIYIYLSYIICRYLLPFGRFSVYWFPLL